jgi:hypothetical protein
MNPAYDRSRVTPLGQTIGRQASRVVQPVIDALVSEGKPDPRCDTCVFRLGTVPNGCLQTQMDASKSVGEGIPFRCHERKGEVCPGWAAAREWRRIAGLVDVVCPWEFSEPDIEEEVAQ